MDRSIDSIGSCSLDADSTDFSDTSESLNFISPSSTREDFTAGITERCRKAHQPVPLTPKLILNQPANQRTTTTTAYFDIDSGKFQTVLSRSGDTNGRYFNGIASESYLTSKTIDLQSPTVVAHANKKPSYLNLACCVNGYSNYTNYDSIQRKEINKSREVSPNRPIISCINMSRQQRSSDNLLSVPAPVTFVKQSPLTSITKRFASLNINDKDKDTTDNAGVMINGNGSVTNRKSFIQQRVEKLYGTTKILTTVKSSDSIQLNGNGTIQHTNGSSNGTTASTTVDEKENDEISMNSLPVMKHLRPEFAKQLQFMSSPKKSLRTSTSNGFTKQIEQCDVSKQTEKNPDQPQIESGNTEVVTSKPAPIKINGAPIEKLNSELVKEVHEISMDTVVKTAEKVVLSAEVIINNNNQCESQTNGKMATETKAPQAETKDGHYFLVLLHNEKARIMKLAQDMEDELEQLQSDPTTSLTEEMNGVVLAAIGKSRLLATKKFKQFEGLCEENLKPKADGPQTLCDDLQGFWDMMMLQVENIDASYSEIQSYRENGWTKPEAPKPQPPKGSRLTKRPLTQSQAVKAKSSVPCKKPSSAPASSEAAQKREEQRKKLMEMKKKHKQAMQNGTDENAVTNGDSEAVGDEPMNGDSQQENGDVEIIL